jgi:8-oxo-dGTP pyrophosphatase MutT (NUDIX family)
MREGIVAVISQGERVLVIRRSNEVPHPNYWAPVSGKIEPGETQAAAVVREVREELGVAALAVRKVWECRSSDGIYRLHWWTADLEEESAVLVLDTREVSEARWIRPAELRSLERVFGADVRFFEETFPSLPD